MDKREKKVITIPAEEVRAKTGAEKKRLRVAAYCRVSTDEERQLGSFENQIEYFTNLIRENGRYELAAIYSDEGISGTSVRRRPGFQAMIAACEAGEIDLIVTKSISRFARNTQDSLSFTRRLKEIGVGVCFEKKGINTLESSGELLLTLFSCFAQEESRSISENTAWGIRSRFRQGIPHLNTTVLLGYDKGPDGELVINEDQAAVVRRVYRRYLEGASLSGIAGELNRDGIPGVKGEVKWCATTVSRLLQNEKYKGALLMQKTFTANYLTRQHVRNTGQLTQYYIAENHPAIIPPEPSGRPTAFGGWGAGAPLPSTPGSSAPAAAGGSSGAAPPGRPGPAGSAWTAGGSWGTGSSGRGSARPSTPWWRPGRPGQALRPRGTPPWPGSGRPRWRSSRRRGPSPSRSPASPGRSSGRPGWRRRTGCAISSTPGRGEGSAAAPPRPPCDAGPPVPRTPGSCVWDT